MLPWTDAVMAEARRIGEEVTAKYRLMPPKDAEGRITMPPPARQVDLTEIEQRGR